MTTEIRVMNTGEMFEVFVPGRLCVIGEHTDWMAPHYSKENNQISNGFCILVCTNEGIFARTQQGTKERAADAVDGVLGATADNQHVGVLSFKTFIKGNASNASVVLDQGYLQLLAKEKGSYLSYVYGTAASVLTHPKVSSMVNKGVGIDIDNYLTTLMMKKGLSSSAAICVTVVRCFNLVYDLELSINEIIDYAFNGERLTHSLCGKMDFVVAIGKGLAVFEFNAQTLEVHILQAYPSPLYFVIADLNSSKDTISILSSLQQCFPTPTSQEQYRLHEYHQRNTQVALDCIRAIEEGDVVEVGKLMVKAQSNFDRAVFDINPVDLASPRLHECLSNTELQRLSVGCKGVGSQGDGSIQVLCRSKEDQEAVVRLLQGPLACGFTFTLTIEGTSNKDVVLFHKCRPRRAVVFVAEETAAQAVATIHALLRLGIEKVYVHTKLALSDIIKSPIEAESPCFDLQASLQQLVLNAVVEVQTLSAVVSDIPRTDEALVIMDASTECIDDFIRKSKDISAVTIGAGGDTTQQAPRVMKCSAVDLAHYSHQTSINTFNDLVEVAAAGVVSAV